MEIKSSGNDLATSLGSNEIPFGEPPSQGWSSFLSLAQKQAKFEIQIGKKKIHLWIH